MTSGNLNVVHASSLVRVSDRGTARRGTQDQGTIDVVADGALAIRHGRIVAVGNTEEITKDFGDAVTTIDATGKTVLPGLVECHSHPLFAGDRHDEYAERLRGATVQEIAARGGGIWSSVVATRSASDEELLQRLADVYRCILKGGATTLEVKSGYGLSTSEESRQLTLLQQSKALTEMSIIISFLGAHIVPRDATDSETYVVEIMDNMLPTVTRRHLADFHDVTCELDLFSPDQAERLLARSRELGLPVRTHADAWASSCGWRTSAQGGAVSAEHLTFTPDDEIREVGDTSTVAVVLPIAELFYMTRRRANARLFIDEGVALAIATDYCASFRSTSILATMALAAPWYQLSPEEVIVAVTLNAAYSLGVAADRGSLDVGKRGDLTILDGPSPSELFVRFGDQNMIRQVVVEGRIVGDSSAAPTLARIS